MQVITARHARGPAPSSVLLGMVVGLILFVGGLVVAYLAFGTTFITRFSPGPRPETTQVLAGMLAWTVALIAPAAFCMAGLARIAAVVDQLLSARSRRSRVAGLAKRLDEDLVVASRLRLPDGRTIPELVVGAFGAAVIEPLPPAAATRRKGDSWEVRVQNGRWVPMENPLERAARDAEGVRRWLARDDQDFVVKVYAAVIAPDTTLPRTPACAVITEDQIPAWLASLPAQRSLTPARRERLIERLRSVA